VESLERKTDELKEYSKVEKERERLSIVPYAVILILALSLILLLNFLNYVLEFFSLIGLEAVARIFFAFSLIFFLIYLRLREKRASKKAEELFKELNEAKEKLSLQVKRLEVINEGMKNLLMVKDISGLKAFLHAFIELLHAEAGMILFKGNGKKIVVAKERALLFRKKELLSQIEESLLSQEMPLLYPSPFKEENSPSFPISSLLFYPLHLNGEVIGGIAFWKEKGKPFYFDDLHVLEALSGEIEVVLENARLFKEKRKMLLGMARALGEVVEMKNPFREGHSKRVAHYARLLSEKLRLPKEERDEIELAAFLHDIGVVGLDPIFFGGIKPLSKEERKVIEDHVKVGASLLKKVGFPELVTSYVLYHHERFDGSGYPEGLKGKEIPLGARIIAVADAFDAITGESIKKASSIRKAFEILKRERGTKFDPAVVDAFLDMYRSASLSNSPAAS
jgi:putative nucleotidyltransferase with HDIG domain